MRRYLSIITLFLLGGLTTLVIGNKQYVRDLYIVSTREVQPSALTIKNELTLTKQADFVYKASLPEVQDSKQFNESCSGVKREQSIVLGCYTGQRFYVFNVDDPRLAGVKEVTAAHELLHAIYERMPLSERQNIDKLVLAQSEQINDERFKQTLEQYKKSEPDQIANELHSILGTEITNLSPELEAHYKQYFKNRNTIVSFANQYAGTFKLLDEQIAAFDLQLKQLKLKIDTSETSLESQKLKLNQTQSKMSSLRTAGEVGQYNALVPGYNASVVSYNASIEQLKQDIASYNQVVEQRNSLATTQNDLAGHLNSNYQPVN